MANKVHSSTTALSVLIFCICSQVCAAGSDILIADTEIASAGYFRLSWKNLNTSSEKQLYVLEEASSSDFHSARTVYRGPDTATLVSGRSNGTYFYRVATQHGEDVRKNQQWSDVTKVQVKHQPLSQAFLFFTLGALVFIATLGAIIMGSRSSNNTVTATRNH